MPIDKSKCLPALLAVHFTFKLGHVQWIFEYANHILESQIMLALIGDVLGFVPLEPDVRHNFIVITNQSLNKCGKPATKPSGLRRVLQAEDR
jgi:hypothetical protein